MKKKYLKAIADGLRKDAKTREMLMSNGIDTSDFTTGLEQSIMECLIEELDEVQFDEFLSYVYDDQKDWPL